MIVMQATILDELEASIRSMRGVKISCITIPMKLSSRRAIVSEQSLIFQCLADPPGAPGAPSPCCPDAGFPWSTPR